MQHHAFAEHTDAFSMRLLTSVYPMILQLIHVLLHNYYHPTLKVFPLFFKKLLISLFYSLVASNKGCVLLFCRPHLILNKQASCPIFLLSSLHLCSLILPYRITTLSSIFNHLRMQILLFTFLLLNILPVRGVAITY